MSIKIERIASQMVKEISYILASEVKDRDLKYVTITDCHVTNDLSFAKVYFMILDESRKEIVLEALQNASGFIRKNLMERLEIRYVPELEFIYDESIAYGKKIEDKIKQIHEKENENKN